MVFDLDPALFQHIALDEAGSTNDEARRLALSGAAADCLVVTAVSQTKGRGRRGRVWISPPGNLHLSLLIRIDGQLAQAAQLGFAASVAVVDALTQLVPGVDFRCKWPNDVLADGRKCAGMLLEAIDSCWLVLGLGVDVVAAPPPDGLVYPVTSLAELGFAGSADQVMRAFVAAFLPRLAEWRRVGFVALRQPWLDRARGLGAQVVVRLDNETLCGTFLGLDADGALLLDQPGQPIRPVHAGDVFFPPV